MPKNLSKDQMRDYDRLLLRSEYASLFGAIIEARRRQPGGFALQRIADGLGIDKSTVSRWFSNDAPNFELNSIADIADQLDVDLLPVQARDRKTGAIYAAHGVTYSGGATHTASDDTHVRRSPPSSSSHPGKALVG
jgi:hypothetical protein